MNPRFFVDSYGTLKVEMDSEQDILITAKFMQRENKNNASEYLRKVAAELTKTYANDPDVAEALLEEAEEKIYQAQLAEKHLELVVL